MNIESVTLRNYRAFGEHGTTIPIGPQFVALLGPNNSGKSTLLRAFWEMRPIFLQLAISQMQAFPYLGAFFGDGITIAQPNLGAGERIETAGSSERPTFTFVFDDYDADPSIDPKSVTVSLGPNATQHVYVTIRDGTCTADATEASLASLSQQSKLVVSIRSGNGQPTLVAWQPLRDAFATLVDTLYVGAFRNAINVGPGAYYDLQVGTGFVEQLAQMKRGLEPTTRDALVRLQNELAAIFDLPRFSVDASDDKQRLVFEIGGSSHQGAELGAGMNQFAIVAANVFAKRPSLLLIDEPELNLHARLQAQFLELLAAYTQGSVIFATHSLGLARTTADEVLVATRTETGEARLDPYSTVPTLATSLGALGYGGLTDPSYSAVLLVEGVTDVRVAHELLQEHGVRGQVVVVPLGGDTLISAKRGQELAELARLSDSVFVLIDSERTSADAPVDRRDQFIAECKQFGWGTLMLQRRAIENYFTQPSLDAVYGGAVRAGGDYDKLSGLDKSKNWRVARELTKQSLSGTDLGQFLQQIADYVQGASPYP